jgi:soluble lytic murein transglycosylase-like protein
MIMNKLLIILLITSNAYAISFDKKHYTVITSIIESADEIEIPRELLLALCWSESSFRTNLPNKLDGKTPSYGICQMKLETAQFIDRYYHNKVKASKQRLLNPKTNARYAAQYLKFQLKRYKGDWRKATDAYNKGRAVSRKSTYVKRITKHYITAARYLASIDQGE